MAWRDHENGYDEPTFRRGLDPMLIVDEERRIVDVNAAACLFLRMSADEARELTLDDLSAAPPAPALAATWEELMPTAVLRSRTRTRRSAIRMPDGTITPIDLALMLHVRPRRHLAIIVPPAIREPDERLMTSIANLTAREREILTLVAAGNTGVEIAARLFLAPTTVQTHVTNALTKLGAKNRANGVAIALRCSQLDFLET